MRILSTNKLVCGGRSGAIWLLSHNPGGCCTLVVVEEIPPFHVKRLPSKFSVYPVPRKALYKCNELLIIIIIDRMMWVHSNSFQMQMTVKINSTPFTCLIDVEITKELPTSVHEMTFESTVQLLMVN